jgi:hypothetical protein
MPAVWPSCTSLPTALATPAESSLQPYCREPGWGPSPRTTPHATAPAVAQQSARPPRWSGNPGDDLAMPASRARPGDGHPGRTRWRGRPAISGLVDAAIETLDAGEDMTTSSCTLITWRRRTLSQGRRTPAIVLSGRLPGRLRPQGGDWRPAPDSPVRRQVGGRADAAVPGPGAGCRPAVDLTDSWSLGGGLIWAAAWCLAGYGAVRTTWPGQGGAGGQVGDGDDPAVPGW